MATLYAQSTGNWDAITWNTAANGSGSNQTPASGDTLVSNNYTVTVNGTYTCVQVTNTSGGTFSLANGSHLTCTDGTAGVLGATADTGAVTFALTGAGEAATLTAKVKGGAGAKKFGVNFTGTQTLTIYGTVTGGTSSGGDDTLSCDGVSIAGAGTLIVNNGSNDALFTGAAHFCNAIRNKASGATISITGNFVTPSPGLASAGIRSIASASMTVVGNIDGGTGNQTGSGGISSTAALTLNVTGNVTSAQSATACLDLSGASVVTINGTVSGAGVKNTAASTITVTAPANGIAAVASAYSAINNTNASAVINVIGRLTADAVPAITNTQPGATLKCTGPFLCSAAGIQAVYSPSLRWYDTRASYFQIRSADLSGIRTLYTANHPDSQSGQPAITDVRHGTVFGPTSNMTGTAYIPAAASVLYGVPVDATTGTAQVTGLSAADIRAAVGLASANLDTQLAGVPDACWEHLLSDMSVADSAGARLKQLATTDEVGGIVAALGA